MDDLISRQAALDISMKYCSDDDGSCSEPHTDLREMLDEIENLPSVDAVEVVRCKDCQCYDSKNYYCTYLDNSNGPDGFCNFGERETDG